jgi:multidrug efflux pump subunit AcrA (membrane-fusion protein)
MKRLPKPVRYGLITLVLLAGVSVVIYAARRAWPNSTSGVLPLIIPIQPRDFTLKINANGELQSAQSMTIAVPFVPVQRLRVASVIDDGRHVAKGDLLIEFDPAELDLEMMEHRSSLEAAVQKISKGELAIGVEKTDIVKDKKIAELELDKIN